MRALALPLLALLSLPACGGGRLRQPGEFVSPALSSEWGCDHAAVMRDAERLREGPPEGQAYRPAEGMTACEVLARVGAPSDTRIDVRGAGRSAVWSYGGGTRTTERTVRFGERTEGWVVYSVDW